MTKHRIVARIALVTLLGLLLAGCSSPQERAAEFVAAAERAFAEGNLESARLEAKNAIQVEPKNIPARWLLARIADREDNTVAMVNNLLIVMEGDKQNADARVMLGEVVVGEGDVEGAESLLADALEIDPDNEGAQMLQARLNLLRNDVRAAIQDLERVLEQDPANTEAAIMLGLALTGRDPEAALKLFNESIAAQTDPAAARPLRQARIDALSLLRRTDDVEKELKALYADFPNDEEIALNLQRFYISQGRIEDLEQMLHAAVERRPDDIQAKFRLAQFQSRYQEDEAETEKVLQGFVSEAPDDLRLPVMLGTWYESRGRDADALAVYEDVVERSPESDEGLAAHNQMAKIHVRQGDFDRAREILDNILEASPGNAAALTLRGELSIAARRFDEAVADLRAAIRKDPENLNAKLSLGDAHGAQGEAVLAEEAYRMALLQDPDNADALTGLSRSLMARGQLDEAIGYFEQLLAVDENNIVALRSLIGMHLAREELDAAEAYIERLTALDDPEALGLVFRGRARQAAGDTDAAIEAYRAALEKNPASPAAINELALTLTIAGRLEEAGREIEKFLQRNPGDANARVMLAGNRLRQDKPAEARELLNDVLDENPQFMNAYLVLASSYPDDAAARIDVYQRALDATPGHGDIAVLLGSEYLRSGETEKAIALYDGLLADGHEDRRFSNNLAALLLDNRDDSTSHERALNLVRDFASSRSPGELDTLGWAYYRTGDFARAVQFLELALAFGGEIAPIRYHLGMAYLATDNMSGARRELEKAIETGGEDFTGIDEARDALERLSAAS